MTEPRVLRVLAPNPGPFTLEGTNTWIVGSPPSAVIDPGPDHGEHLHGVLDQAGEIGVILLTHHHPDHAPGAARLGRLAGAPVRAVSPSPDELPLEDGQTLEVGGVALRVVWTPGHTRDHAVFFEPRTRALFTGDAVLGWGTSVIDPPEGDLAEYLRSLHRMLALGPEVLYPGHGPTVRPALPKLHEYLEHRSEREGQVLRALRRGPATPEEIVPEIYADYPMELHPAAARSVLAHLLKLEREDRVVRVGREKDRFSLSGPARSGRTGGHGAGSPAGGPG